LLWSQIKSVALGTAAGLVFVAGLVTGVKALNDRTTSRAAPALVQSDGAPQSAVPVPQVTAALSQSRPHQLLLTVIDAVDEAALPRTHVKVKVSGPNTARFDRWTDSKGQCVLAFPTKRFAGLTAWVFAPGHVGKAIEFKASGGIVFAQVPMFDCSRGRAMNGVVQDESGEPLPQAKITLQPQGPLAQSREFAEWRPDMAFVTSDSAGRWTCDFIPPDTSTITLFFTHQVRTSHRTVMWPKPRPKNQSSACRAASKSPE
jgi:hypothetical protein